MANSVGINLGGKTVIFPAKVFNENYQHLAGMPFKVDDNGLFGTSPKTTGGKISGVFANGMCDVMRGEYVQAVVEDDPTLDRIAALYNESDQEAENLLKTPSPSGGYFIPLGRERHQKANELLKAKLLAEGIINNEGHFIKGPCADGAKALKHLTKKRLKELAPA